MNLDKNHLPDAVKYNGPPLPGSNKTEQFLQENITWKKLLYFFIQENSFLKTRLSEVVDKENDSVFIARAEQFQTEFIIKDECIIDIGNDIKTQEEALQRALEQMSEPDQKLCKMQGKLRNEMTYLENEFAVLKTQFNKYLLSI